MSDVQIKPGLCVMWAQGAVTWESFHFPPSCSFQGSAQPSRTKLRDTTLILPFLMSLFKWGVPNFWANKQQCQTEHSAGSTWTNEEVPCLFAPTSQAESEWHRGRQGTAPASPARICQSALLVLTNCSSDSPSLACSPSENCYLCHSGAVLWEYSSTPPQHHWLQLG